MEILWRYYTLPQSLILFMELIAYIKVEKRYSLYMLYLSAINM